jgi:hypothetical protein
LLTLESYLSEGIHRDREDVIAVERVLRETADTINTSFDRSRKDWPYEINDAPEKVSRSYSQSTATMMVNAINLLQGFTQNGRPRAPYAFDLGKIGANLEDKRADAFEKLVQEIAKTKEIAEKHGRKKKRTTAHGKAVVTSSGTYGRNDSLTLSFLAEVEGVKSA